MATQSRFACRCAISVLLAASAAIAQQPADPATPATPATPTTPSVAPAGTEISEPQAAEAVRNIAEWNLPKRGEKLALKGYDPVAYFAEGGGKATAGLKTISADHKGVTYRFATAANRELFLANPERYEPAHGGWCSWAMREKDKVEVDPKSFIVKGDRLFLFYDGLLADTRSKWLTTEHEASAATADAAWKSISKEEKRAATAK